MKIIKDIFNFTIFVQICLLFVFLVLNYENLDEIEYIINFTRQVPFVVPTYNDSGWINGTTTVNVQIELVSYVLVINFYYVLLAVVGLYGLVMVASLSLVDSGLNDIGTTVFSKFVAFISFYVIINLANAYYIQNLGTVGFILLIIISLIWFFRGTMILQLDGDDND